MALNQIVRHRVRGFTYAILTLTVGTLIGYALVWLISFGLLFFGAEGVETGTTTIAFDYVHKWQDMALYVCVLLIIIVTLVTTAFAYVKGLGHKGRSVRPETQ